MKAAGGRAPGIEGGPVLVWITVALTLYSGLGYAWRHRADDRDRNSRSITRSRERTESRRSSAELRPDRRAGA